MFHAEKVLQCSMLRVIVRQCCSLLGHCSAVKRSTVQCCTVNIAMQCSTVQYSTVYSALQCSAVQCCTVYSAIQCIVERVVEPAVYLSIHLGYNYSHTQPTNEDMVYIMKLYLNIDNRPAAQASGADPPPLELHQ